MPSEPPTDAVVLLYQGCTVAEVIELATRLVDADITVTYAAVSTATVIDRSGLLLQPDVTVAQLDPATVGLLVLPGGDPEAVIEDRSVAGLLIGVAGAGGVIAGICAGVLILAAAGLARGRSITHNYRAPWAPPEVSAFVERFWDGATVEPDPAVGVVVDGHLVTALPNATIEFAMTVCEVLGLHSAERAAQLGRHLRGEYVAGLHGHG